MIYTLENVKRILEIYENDVEVKRLINMGDIELITKINHDGYKKISPEDVIAAVESGDLKTLYKKAKNMKELQTLYEELCEEYYKQEERKYHKKMR